MRQMSDSISSPPAMIPASKNTYTAALSYVFEVLMMLEKQERNLGDVA